MGIGRRRVTSVGIGRFRHRQKSAEVDGRNLTPKKAASVDGRVAEVDGPNLTPKKAASEGSIGRQHR